MHHKISHRIRRRINSSGRALCDVCRMPELLHGHHILGRKISDPHHPSNIANLCPNCHNRVHRGLIEIDGWRMTSSGLELEYVERSAAAVTA